MKFSIRDFVFATAAVVVPTTRASFVTRAFGDYLTAMAGNWVSGWNINNNNTTAVVGTVAASTVIAATGLVRHVRQIRNRKLLRPENDRTTIESEIANRSDEDKTGFVTTQSLQVNSVTLTFIANGAAKETVLYNNGDAYSPRDASGVKISIRDNILKVEAFEKSLKFPVDDVSDGKVTFSSLGISVHIFFKSKEIDNDYALYSIEKTDHVRRFDNQLDYSVMSFSEAGTMNIVRTNVVCFTNETEVVVGSSTVFFKVWYMYFSLYLDIYRGKDRFSGRLGHGCPLDFLSLVEGSDGKVHVFMKTPGNDKISHKVIRKSESLDMSRLVTAPSNTVMVKMDDSSPCSDAMVLRR